VVDEEKIYNKVINLSCGVDKEKVHGDVVAITVILHKRRDEKSTE
jgi:hypothetical protein